MLKDAGVADESFRLISALRDVGHLAGVHFRTAAEGNLAKSKVRLLKRTNVAGKFVFLNTAKAQDELKPGRMAYKASKELENLEQAFETAHRKEITMDQYRGSILVGGVRAGFATNSTTKSEWLWTPVSEERYEKTALTLAKQWIDTC